MSEEKPKHTPESVATKVVKALLKAESKRALAQKDDAKGNQNKNAEQEEA
jgi:hypothetical protein